MSSPCLTGGGRTYGIDLDLVKSPTGSSSTSSTLSESSNSTPLAISTKRARTHRKRPNQSYTEAAALLAKACPTIFSAKQLSKHCRVVSRDPNLYLDSASELLPSFPALSGAGFLLCDPARESARLELDSPTSCPEFFSGAEFGSYVEDRRKCKSKKNGMEVSQESESGLKCEIVSPGLEFDDEFDTESILDEEVGEGIDSIMGVDYIVGVEEQSEPNDYGLLVDPYLGQLGAVVNVTRALRHVGNGDWWSSPTVEIGKIVPEMKKPTPILEKNKSKKKKKKVEKEKELDVSSTPEKSNRRPGLGLKLDCDGVMKEWLGNGSPFSGELDSSESPADIIAKLSDIDLLSEVAGSGGMREACVLRYKEKRRSRLFSKKVRYQVRKVNADKRPRTKGRFVKRDDEEEEVEEDEAALRS